MTKKILLAFVLLLGFLAAETSAQGQKPSAQPIQLLASTAVDQVARQKLAKTLKAYKLFDADPTVLKTLEETRPAEFKLGLELPGLGLTDVSFQSVAPFEATTFWQHTANGDELLTNYRPGFFSKGTINGDPASTVLLAIYPNGDIMGLAYSKKWHGNIVIGRLAQKDVPVSRRPVIIYNDLEMKVKNPFYNNMDDEVLPSQSQHDDHEVEKGVAPVQPSTQSGSCRSVSVYWEGGLTYYQLHGNNVTTATNNLTFVYFCTDQLLNVERLDLTLSRMVINTTNDGVSTTNINTGLTNFGNNLQASSAFVERLGHYFYGDNSNFGGLAYVDVVCSSFKSLRSAVSNLYNEQEWVPTYSWNAEVATHETGHNLGSRHTQWCGWDKGGGVFGILDSCVTAEPNPSNAASCYTGPAVARVGTIMSYCHLNGSIDLALGFGPIPGATIRSKFNSASCLSGATSPPTITVTGPTNVCIGGSATFEANLITNATYQWKNSNNQTFAAGRTLTINGITSGAAGTYYCEVTIAGCTYISQGIIVTTGCFQILTPSKPFSICQGASSFPVNVVIGDNAQNPAGSSVIAFSVRNIATNAATSLGSVTGQLTYNGNVTTNVSSLAAGVYKFYITVTHRGNTTTVLTYDLAVSPKTTAATGGSNNICNSGTTTFSGTASMSAYRWLNGSNSQVGTNQSYTTPTISSSQTFTLYQTQQQTTTGFGRTAFTNGGLRTVSSSTPFYNILHVMKTCTLTSVKCSTGVAGRLRFSLVDSLSYDTAFASYHSLSAGLNTVNLTNCVMRPGIYKMMIEGSDDNLTLYRSNPSATFPYTIPGYVHMPGANPGNGFTNGIYYWYYDMTIVRDLCESDPATFTANVITNPTPTITAGGPTTFCTGGSVTLTAPAGFTYLWSNSATTQSINVTTAGSYTVRTISNGCTSAVSAATVVTVNTAPSIPTITAGGPTTFCTGGSVTLTAPSGFTYLWSNSATTQSINVTTAGSYTVRTISNGCTSAVSAATVVTVNTAPSTPTITAGGPTTFCTGGSVTLTAPAGFSYLWSNNATTQSINVTTAGSYTVRTISNGCTSAVSAATVVTVNTAPSTPTITAGGPTTFCTGGSVTLTAPAGFTYLWSNSATTQSINVTTAGSYTVRTISNGCTSAVSAATVVTVNTPPSTPTITPNGPTTFNTGGSVELSAPSGFSYLWSNNATTQTITVTNSGTFTVQLIGNGCTSAASAPVVVTVNAPSANVWRWNGTGNFTDASNWTPQSVPTRFTADSIIIESGTCTLDLNLIMHITKVNSGARLDLSTNRLTVTTRLNNDGIVSSDQGSLSLDGNQILGTGTVQLSSIGSTVNTTKTISNKVGAYVLDWAGPVSVVGNGEVRLRASASVNSYHIWPATYNLTNPDQFVVETYINPALADANGGWFYVGPPVKNYQVGNLALNNSFSANTYNNNVATGSSLYLYNPLDNTWPTNNGFVKAPSASYQLQDHEGVRVWLKRTRLQMGVFEFKGLPFSTDVSMPLAFCPSGCTYGSPNGFNLIKNPFPINLDWEFIASTGTGFDKTTWIYQHNLCNFAIYNNGVGINGGGPVIARGQAFFVRSTAPGTMLNVSVGAATQAPSTFKSQNRVTNVLRVHLFAGTKELDEVAIRFDQNARLGDDQLDALDMSQGINLSTRRIDNALMAINSLPLTGSTRIPLVVSNPAGTLSLKVVYQDIQAGTQLYLDHPSFAAPMPVFDGMQINLSANLLTGLEIVANPPVTQTSGFTKSGFVLSPNPATSVATVSLVGQGELINLAVLDQLGRTVVDRAVTGTTAEIQLKDLAAATYTIRLTTTNGIVTDKLVVIK